MASPSVGPLVIVIGLGFALRFRGITVCVHVLEAGQTLSLSD